MSTARTFAHYSPLRLDERSPAFQALAVVMGSLILSASSYITVPMVPVPMTMQTFAVTLIGALYGWRLGALTTIAWLMEGALGLPVLAGGASGVQHFLGKTGGYLFAFPLAAACVGWLAQRGWNGHHAVMAFWAMLAGNALCLALGGAWLAALIGWKVAVAAGVAPFLLGALLKSVLAAGVLKAAQPVAGPRDSV
jgi:biotin transport system substrate-specific component